MAKSVIGALRVNLGLDSARFSKGAKEAENTARRLGRNMQRIGAAMSAVGAGVALAIRGQLNAADRLGKTAQSIGVPVEQLSQLRYAADLSGASMEGLERGLRNLGREMANNPAKFAALGVAVRDANGEMRPTVDVLQDVSDRLAGMPDGAEKTAAAMKLFGDRAGPELVPLLNAGSAGIRAMMEEADRLGLTIDEKTAVSAANFNDNLTRLGKTIGGLTTRIASNLAPALERISEVIANVAMKFGQMSPQAQKFASVIAGITVVVGPLTVALGLLLTALSAISLPVLAVVAAVTAATAAVVAFWPEIVALKDRLVELGTVLAQEFQAKIDAFVQMLWNLPAQMMEVGAEIINGLVEGITQKWEELKQGVFDVGENIKQGFKDMFGIQSPSRVFAEFGRFLMEGLGLGISDNARVPVGALAGVGADLKGGLSAFNVAIGDTSDRFGDLVVGILSGSQKASSALENVARGLASQAFSGLVKGTKFGEMIGNVLSFEGGGFTGAGARVGGLDGRGGMLAVVHPNETVVDHTRGQAIGGGTVVNVINNSGAPVDERRSRGPDGQETVDIMVGRSIADGRQDAAFASRFGARPQRVRR